MKTTIAAPGNLTPCPGRSRRLALFLPLFLLVVLLSIPAPLPAAGPVASPAKPAAASKRVKNPADVAIDNGLKFLAESRNADGSWSAIGYNSLPAFPQAGQRATQRSERQAGDLAVTALAVMAFLSAGHVPGEGPYADCIASGIRFVLNGQQKNGLFAAPFGGAIEMYYHGVCTLMLAEVIGMTEKADAQNLRKRLSDAITAILAGQRVRGRDIGGWRYQLTGVDADLSVSGWQIMALRAAKNVGCDVPSDRITSAVAYIRRCHDAKSGGYTYTAGGQVTVPCTGVGILALELCGKEYHNSEEAQRAGSYLLKTPVAATSQHFFYGIYYTAQAMFQLGGNYWKEYRPVLHKLLIETNRPVSDGAWIGLGGWDDVRFGKNYCTAMAILALTVEYRFLPIYQRFEEPLERDERD